MSNLSDDDLLRELGVEYEVAKVRSYTPREERIIAGFEEIQQFVKSMVASRNMVKRMIFLRDYMQCGLIDCVQRRIVEHFLLR